jgi:hypothetical protein
MISNLHLLLIILFFCIGYILGYIRPLQPQQTLRSEEKKKTFLDRNTQNELEQIKIDSKKFVVDIDTSKMEKKFTKLGDIKQSNDNISESINKLKNIKG